MNARKLLTSLAVTVMLTDVLLLALAFAPATVPNGTSNHEVQSAMAQQSATPQVLLAGGGQRSVSEAEQFAGLGRWWACAKCAVSYVGGILIPGYTHDPNSGSCRKCQGNKTK
jgi:hypothetical protein